MKCPKCGADIQVPLDEINIDDIEGLAESLRQIEVQANEASREIMELTTKLEYYERGIDPEATRAVADAAVYHRMWKASEEKREKQIAIIQAYKAACMAEGVEVDISEVSPFRAVLQKSDLVDIEDGSDMEEEEEDEEDDEPDDEEPEDDDDGDGDDPDADDDEDEDEDGDDDPFPFDPGDDDDTDDDDGLAVLLAGGGDGA